MDLHRVTTDHCLDGYCCRAGSSIWSLRIIVGELLVLAGTGSPVPPESGPNLADPDVSPDDLAGKHVETGGEVIATDPVVIDVDDSTTTQSPLRMRRTCTLARTVSCWWGTRSRYPGGMTGSPIRKHVVLDAAILSGLNRIELVLPTTTMRE